MGVMPVGKLLFSMSLPIMISMLVQALYNVVDSMFVARVSENALTALSRLQSERSMLGFPIRTEKFLLRMRKNFILPILINSLSLERILKNF